MFKGKLASYLKIKSSIHIYIYSILIGILVGLSTILFSFVIHYFENLIFHQTGFKSSESSKSDFYFLIVFIPALGGFFSALTTQFFCPEAKGNGTDEIIKSFHYKGGYIPLRVPFFKSIATIFTIGTGGSAGKEGPTMQIGAGIGSSIANLFRGGDRARRSLMIAGVAGGLGAIFKIPFGGAFTAIEVVYKEDLESDTIVPAFLSSITAYLVSINFTEKTSLLTIPEVGIHHLYELFFYFILGFVCLLFGYIFTKLYTYTKTLFENLKIPFIWKPTIGGLLVGFFLLFFSDLRGDGIVFLQKIIKSISEIQEDYLFLSFYFLVIALLKMVLTSFTVGSGGSGGLFVPSLFIGGMLGLSFGSLTKHFFPNLELSLINFFLIGMSGFFTGIAHAPIAGMLMVCDVIENYTLLPALIIVSVVNTVFSKWSIYQGQIENRFHSPAHYWDMNFNILKRIKIQEIEHKIRKTAVVEPHLLLSDLEDRSLRLKETDFIVVSSEGYYKGICSLKKFHHSKETESLIYLLTVDDVYDASVPPLSLQNSLSDVLKIMHEKEVDKVAIIDNQSYLRGYIRFLDIIQTYFTVAK
ncbi:MAG: chloride channel protein [Leptonema sp. (in: bacteria)]